MGKHGLRLSQSRTLTGDAGEPRGCNHRAITVASGTKAPLVGQTMASSGLDQQRSKDETDGTSALKIKSTRMFFALEDVRDVQRTEAYWSKVKRQLELRHDGATV